MIKYLGSKRRLVPALTEIFKRSGAKNALDLFTGTTRVAQAFKAEGGYVTAVDIARYSHVFASCYIATDAATVDRKELADAISYLSSLPGEDGYFTEVFCRQSRFFQPFNGQRVDAIRNAIEAEFSESPLRNILLTSLIEAADRVDSTTGVQMAYVKSWAERSYKDLELRVPDLLDGSGVALRGDAMEEVSKLGHFDLAYLDPPYNQHRYFTNYHIWETLVAWDAPEYYGVACKRVDARDDSTKSVFNKKREMPKAFEAVIKSLDARVVVISYNNESWLLREDLEQIAAAHGSVVTLAFDSKRYVGAQIGIHNLQGERVGEVSHLRNLELVVVAGPADEVRHITEPYATGSVDSGKAQASLF